MMMKQMPFLPDLPSRRRRLAGFGWISGLGTSAGLGACCTCSVKWLLGSPNTIFIFVIRSVKKSTYWGETSPESTISAVRSRRSSSSSTYTYKDMNKNSLYELKIK